MPETPLPPPSFPEPPKPAALVRRNQILAVLGIVIAAAIPIALAFGFDVCGPLDAVGIELDACPKVQPLPAPSPGAGNDAGAE